MAISNREICQRLDGIIAGMREVVRVLEDEARPPSRAGRVLIGWQVRLDALEAARPRVSSKLTLIKGDPDA